MKNNNTAIKPAESQTLVFDIIIPQNSRFQPLIPSYASLSSTLNFFLTHESKPGFVALREKEPNLLLGLLEKISTSLADF